MNMLSTYTVIQFYLKSNFFKGRRDTEILYNFDLLFYFLLTFETMFQIYFISNLTNNFSVNVMFYKYIILNFHNPKLR